MINALEIRNLKFSYLDKVILYNISISIKQGEFVAVVGENGAGKSTLIKIVIGDIKNYSGTVKIFEKSIKESGFYKDIAYISQSSITNYKNFPTTVSEMLNIHLKYLNNKQNVEHYLKLVGLENHHNKILTELSGGELQRLALALALLKDAKIIILDEPTSAIDKKFSREIFKLLRKISNEGKTIMMVTHSMFDVIDLVDNVVLVENKVCRYLNKDEIVKGGGSSK